ncbi:hypothetical protein [Streptosporangium sp. NPDC051022]|uniref:hypothetical protein n=1 Tax=Streptosporangium sp. NPDC051022 TaxID=3155752 RepID=UPI0034275B14
MMIMMGCEGSLSKQQEAYFQEWEAQRPLSVREQKEAAAKRLVAAAGEFKDALVVPLTHPDTGEDLLPNSISLPLDVFVELSRIAIRRAMSSDRQEAALNRLNAASEELYAAIRWAAEPAVGEGATTWPKVPSRTMVKLTGLKMHTVRQITRSND